MWAVHGHLTSSAHATGDRRCKHQLSASNAPVVGGYLVVDGRQEEEADSRSSWLSIFPCGSNLPAQVVWFPLQAIGARLPPSVFSAHHPLSLCWSVPSDPIGEAPFKSSIHWVSVLHLILFTDVHREKMTPSRSGYCPGGPRLGVEHACVLATHASFDLSNPSSYSFTTHRQKER